MTGLYHQAQRQGWQTSPQHDGLLLQHAVPQSGWFMLQATAAQPLRLQMDSLHTEIALHLRDGRQTLIFPAVQLQQLCIRGAIPASLSVRRLPAWRAYSLLFAAVGRQTGRRRLFDLCVARYRRSGMAQVRRKLLEAYQPLLLQLQRYADPYQQWQKQQPPVLAPAGAAKTLIFVLCADEDGLWQHSVKTLRRQSRGDWQLWLQHCSLAPADARIVTQHQLQADAWYWPLQAGDLLDRHAVALLQQVLASEPACQLLFSDHDQPTAAGQRQAHFKAAFCYDSYLSRDYLSPALLYRGTLLQQIGEHLWQLSAAERLAHALLRLEGPLPAQIRHLAWPLLQHRPKPLTAASLAELAALRRQLVLQQEGLEVTVQPTGAELFRVRYPLPAAPAGASRPGDAPPASPLMSIPPVTIPPVTIPLVTIPLVTIIVPTRDQLQLTRTCVESVLQRTAYRPFEILLVDNQSADPDTLAWFAAISQHPQVRVLRYDAAFNYSAINNFAVRHTQAPFVCLLNNDTEVLSPDWLAEMLQHAARPQIGCVGAKLLYADHTVQHGGVVLGLWGLAGHSHKHFPAAADGYLHRLQSVQNYSAVTAACLLLRRELYLSVGGLNETALTVAFNDVDLCLKVQAAGYRNLWTPYAVLFHHESKSRGREDTPEKKARERAEVLYMQQQWPAPISDDPCYSPHLTRQREDYSIALDENPAAGPLLR